MKSIRIKASAFLLVLILGTVGLLSYLSLTGIKHYQTEQLEAYLAAQARTANVMAADGLTVEKEKAIIRQMTSDSFMSAALYDMKGHLKQASSFQNAPDPRGNWAKTALAEALKGKIAYTKLSVSETYGNPVVDYYAPLFNDNRQIGVLRLRYEYQGYTVFYEAMSKQISMAAGGVFVAATLIGLWYFGREARAVQILKEAVESVAEHKGYMAEHKAFQRLQKRQDEYGALSQGIWQMAETIKGQIGALESEQQKLMSTLERLKLVELKQRQFFGGITHEFKTPLSVINAVNDLAELYPDDTSLAKDRYVKTKAEVQRLTEMVEQTLSLARASKYDFEIQWVTLNLYEVVEQALNRLKPKADKYGIQMALTGETKALVRADEEAVSQIIVNLLDNAIKYNRNGGQIRITLEAEASMWVLAIADTGHGMPEALRLNPFEAFASKNRDNLTEVKGSGLGLALAAQLSEQLGAQIALVKSDEQGTTMAFSMTQYCHETDKTLK